MQKFILNVGLACLCVCAGCDQTEEIRQYQVAKPAEQAEQPAAPVSESSIAQIAPPEAHQGVADAGEQRMLAAMILQAEQAWFFKTVGPKSRLESQVDAFRGLLESVHFAEGKPQWKLPQNWREKAGSGMRFATLEFGPEEEPVEVTVIPLPIPPGDREAYVLSNLNRWRQQLNLPPLAATELDQQSERIELDGSTAVLVDFHGN